MSCARIWLGLSLLVGMVLIVGAPPAAADNTPQSLPFSQDWTNTGLITANDNWSGAPGIEGYLGQDITTATGTDPQTLLTTSAVANDLDVIANQTNTGTSNGGVAEFEITNPVVALQGSGTADAPYVILNLNTTGLSNVNIAYNLRDIDGTTTDNAVQQVALQYRVGSSGNFTNVPAGYVADATTGPNLATLVTPVSVTLPGAVDNQALAQVRVITSNAVGNERVGRGRRHLRHGRYRRAGAFGAIDDACRRRDERLRQLERRDHVQRAGERDWQLVHDQLCHERRALRGRVRRAEDLHAGSGYRLRCRRDVHRDG